MSLLAVRDLAVRIGAARPVAGVSFDLAEGETFALLGESGCGKSMTALALMRLLPDAARIDAGAVSLGGVDLLALTEAEMRRRRGGQAAMIFQEPGTSLNPVLTIGRQIGESLAMHRRLNGKEALEAGVELLRAVGIPDPRRRWDEYPFQLSGGMKQRAMIAMALAGEPRLLIADEPTTALDVTIQAQILALLAELRRALGMSIILITHNLGVVRETSSYVYVMHRGRIVEQAATADLFAAPRETYTRNLIASVPRLTGGTNFHAIGLGAEGEAV